MSLAARIDNQPLKQPQPGLGPLWEFHSARIKRRLSGVGLLLLDHFVRLECDPNVQSYQPWFSLLPGPEHAYSDALVTLRDGPKELQTARFSTSAADGLVLEHQRIEAECANKHGWKQRLLTESDIRDAGEYLRNCHAMRPWLSDLHTPAPAQKRAVLGTIASEERPITIGKLAVKSGASEPDVVAIVVREYTQRRLRLEDVHTRPFGRGSLVATLIST